MPVSRVERGLLDRLADRIEEVLSSYEIPIRVHGGEVGQEWVRYHLTPLSQEQSQRIHRVTKRVAEAMGVYQVRVAEVEDGLALDLPIKNDNELRLLPLLEDLRGLLPLTAVIGISTNGQPLLINLRRMKTWHMFVTGKLGSGKSELLRTILLSLAFASRPSQLQFLGIDLSGRELTCIESLPHALAEVACDIDYALEIVDWLYEEAERRKRFNIHYPDLVLLIDDIERLEPRGKVLISKMDKIIRIGSDTGIHMIATENDGFRNARVMKWRREESVIARARRKTSREISKSPSVGQFEFHLDGGWIHSQVAWMPVKDLQVAVSSIRTARSKDVHQKDLRSLW
ncbi:MAG: hypothetical protein GTO18_15700 [Anaerolineales bacterium]|nr:hypothetical protein [Anaerolineales bacterium]